MLGLRFLQASLLVPLYRGAAVGTRALPIRFEEVSCVKRPGKKATEEQRKQYRQAVKQQNLSRRFVQMGHQLRLELDLAGGQRKIPVLTGDGSFCNRTCFRDIPQRSILLVRARKDACLCFRAPNGSRRFYGVEKFTPEQVRLDEARPWKTAKIFYGGKRRKIRYKEVAGVYWQRGAAKRPLRVIYFDRWQIEVNHREEKDTLGVGQAQLWNVVSVPKQPVLAVAAYSALLLASLKAFGAERGKAYAELPKWRRKARRPSCLDLITLLRKEMAQQPEELAAWGLTVGDSAMVQAAAA